MSAAKNALKAAEKATKKRPDPSALDANRARDGGDEREGVRRGEGVL